MNIGNWRWGWGATGLKALARVQADIESIKKIRRDQEIDQIEQQVRPICERGGADVAKLAKRSQALELTPSVQ